jgi:hypothetical protein
MTDSTWVPIRDYFVDGVAWLAKFVAPMLSIAATVFGFPVGVTNVLKAIPALMSAVEIAIPEAGSGPAKKQQVLDSAKALMDIADSKLQGGAKNSFDTYKPFIEALIDNGVAAINASAPKIIASNGPSTTVETGP